MNEHHNQLTIPQQHAPTGKSFDTRPRVVDAWVENLPLANIGETAKLLYGVLIETNRTQMDSATRLKLLQKLNKPILHVFQALEKHYLGLRFPLPEKNRKVSALIKSMLLELCIGYKCILSNTLLKGESGISRSQICQALYHAMVCNNRLLLTCYQTYTPPPHGIWQEHHLLYQQALQLGMHDFMLMDNSETHSIASRHKQAILLALTSPRGLTQTEITELYQLFGKWASFCHLLSSARHHYDDKKFIIDLDSDEPPSSNRQQAHDHNHRSLFYVDVSELLPILQQQITRQKNNPNNETSISHELLADILNSWHGRKKRQFSRLPKHELAQVAIGLSAIHDQLTKQLNEDNAESRHKVSERAVYRGSFIPSLSFNDAPDVWDLNKPSNNTDVDLKSDTTPKYQTHLFRILDESANGYQLKETQNSHPDNLKVGELCSVQTRQKNNHMQLSIGFIRWIHNHPKDGMTLGVQLLAPTAIPVAIQPYNETLSNNLCPPMRALLLPELPAIKQTASLLTANNFKQGNNILLLQDSPPQHLVLNKQLRYNVCFSQFQFKLVKHMGEQHHSKHYNQDQEIEDFDNIWSLL